MAGSRRVSSRVRLMTRMGVVVSVLASVLVVLPGSTSVAAAAPADLDGTFGTGGSTVTALAGRQDITDLLVQPDGKIVVSGIHTPAGSSYTDFLVARYLPNGQLDTSFGSGGRTITSFGAFTDLAQAIGRQADGKIVLGGFAHTGEFTTEFALARYNADGTPDLTFGSMGKKTVDVSKGNDLAHAMVIQPNGKIVLAGAGNYNVVDGHADTAFARVTADGSADTTFADDGTVVHAVSPRGDVAADVVLAPDGSIVASGYADRASDAAVDHDFSVLRLEGADGSLDATFSDDGKVTFSPDGGVTEVAQDVVVQSDGKIIVVGATATTGTSKGVVARLTESGALDPAFGEGGIALSDGGDRAFAEVALDSTGKIVAVGHEEVAPSDTDVLVHRFAYDGANDDAFGEAGAVTGSYGTSAGAMAIQSDGRILVGGGADGTDGLDMMVARYLGNPPAPVASSGSGRVVFTASAGGSADIYVTGEDGSNPVAVVTHPATDSDPSLSPDGSQLLFVSDRLGAGQRDVFVQPMSGGTPTPVASGGFWDSDPEWAPDGSRFAFTSNRDGQFDIFVSSFVDGEVSIPVNLTGGDGRDDGFPTWSPDGSTIAFRSSTPGGNEDIYSIPSAGGVPTRLTEDAGNDTSPSWSPDGTRIAFASNRAGTSGYDVFVMDTAGNGEARLTTTTGNDWFPEWSGDGRNLFFEGQRTGGTSLVARGVDSGAESVLTACVTNSCTPSAISNLFLEVLPPPIYFDREYAFVGDPGEYEVAAPADGSYHVQASPTRVPLSAVPLHPSAPNIRTAPIGLLDLSTSPIGLLDVSTSPLGLLDLSTSPLGLLDLSTSPLGLLDLSTSPLGLLDLSTSPLGLLDLSTSPLGLLDLSTSPVAADALDRILLSQVPLRSPASWEQVLGRPVVTQSETLGSALRELEAAGNSVFFHELETAGPLNDVSVYSVLLGRTPLSALPQPSSGPTWCQRVENVGYLTCGDELVTTGNAMDASPLQLQLSGVAMNGVDDRSFPLQLVRLGDIDAAARAAAPYGSLRLARFENIGGSRLGTLPLSAVDPSLLDCTYVDCASGNLADAAAVDGAIRDDATFADLGTATDNLLLGELVGAVLPVGAAPVAGLDLDQLNVYGYKGTGTSGVDFRARYRPLGAAVTNPLVHVDLPESFFIEADTATYSIDGGGSLPIRPALAGHRATFAIPGVVPAGQEIVITYRTRPGVRLATVTSDVSVVSSGLRQDLLDAAPVTVNPSFEPDAYTVEGNTVWGGTPLYEEELVISHVQPGDRDFFTFPAPAPGTRIDIAVGNTTFDVDAVLYEILDGGRRSLRATPTEHAASSDIVIPVPDDGVDLTNTGEPLTAEIREDIVFENLPVASVSANRGKANEYLTAVSTPDARAYVLQLSGFLGAASDLPVTVFMRQTAPAPLPACAPRDWASATTGSFPAPLASVPADTTSLVLLNGDRLIDRFSASQSYTLDEQQPASAADAVAAVESMSLEVNEPDGVEVEVLRLDAFESVRAAYAAADQNPCDIERANDVVRAINDVVDSVIASSPGLSLDHLTIIGDDEVIPMARIPDLTVAANESGFAGDLAFLDGNTALRAAHAGGYLPSDDPYGDLTPTPYLGRWMYVTDLALGRVVETPAEITAAVSQFIGSRGVLNPTTAVTTAYDFMKKTGQVIDGYAEAQLGAPQTDLISDVWTKESLANVFSNRTGGAAGITSLNAHFDHYRAQPAAAATVQDLYSTSEVATGSSLTGRIIHTMGCHSGTSIADVTIGSSSLDVAKVRDWAQVVSAKGAPSFVGQTGYGLGLDGLVELSSKILGDYAKNLASSPSAGAALAAAKRAYADALVGDAGAPTASFFGVYDEKALVEATYFGFPMYRVSGLAPVPAAAPVPTSQVSAPTPTAAHIGSIQASEVVITPTLTETAIADQGTQLDWRGNRLVTADRPILPMVQFDAPAGLHGALITELASTDRANFNPDFANVKVDSASKELERETGDVIFPAAPHGVTRSKVLFVPAQFRTTNAKAGTGTLRQFTKAKVKLLTSSSDDFIKPRISAVQGLRVTTDRIDLTVVTTDVTPHGPGSVVQVVVPVFDESGTWKFAHLARDPGTDTWRGSVNVVGRRAQYGVQAVDAAGNVGMSFNKGDLFDVVVPKPANAYKLEGFFSPIKNNALNGVQAGRTVPVKWRLYDANGIVRNLLVVEVIDTEEIACDNRQVMELSLLNLPLSALTYDLIEDQYSYGFATSKEWARTCRRLNVRLNDGTVHTVDFAFKA